LQPEHDDLPPLRGILDPVYIRWINEREAAEAKFDRAVDDAIARGRFWCPGHPDEWSLH
jgi:hypothetical protein